MKLSAWWLLLPLPLAFLAGRCARPPVIGPSRDSLALVAWSDSIGVLLARLQFVDDSAKADMVSAGQHAAVGAGALAAGDAHRPSVPAPAPLSAEADTAEQLTYYRAREGYLEDQLATQTRKASEYRHSAEEYRAAQLDATKAASRWYSSYTIARTELDKVQDSLPKVAIRIGRLEGDLHRARNGTRIGLAADAQMAGGAFTSVMGLSVAVRRSVLGMEGSASATAGLGLGGDIAGVVKTGPGLAMQIRLAL